MRNANGGLAALWRFAVVPTCDHRQRRLIVKACVSLWLAHLSEVSALRPLSSHRRRSVCPHRTLFNTSCVCWAGAWERGRASRSLFDHQRREQSSEIFRFNPNDHKTKQNQSPSEPCSVPSVRRSPAAPTLAASRPANPTLATPPRRTEIVVAVAVPSG